MSGVNPFLQTTQNFKRHPYEYEDFRGKWAHQNGSIRLQSTSQIGLFAGQEMVVSSNADIDIVSGSHVNVSAAKRLTLEGARQTTLRSTEGLTINAGGQIRLTNRAGGVVISPEGNIRIYGKSLTIDTSGGTSVNSSRIDLN